MLTRLIRKLRALFGLPDYSSTDPKPDSPLANYKWSEDPTYTESPSDNPDAQGDDLAGAIFKGRPSNPLSDDW